MGIFQQLSMFSKNFKFLRKKHGLSQVVAAEKIGISKNTVQNYEDGKSEPDISILVKICALFNVPIQNLVFIDIEKTNDTLNNDLSLDQMDVEDLKVLIITQRNQISTIKENFIKFLDEEGLK